MAEIKVGKNENLETALREAATRTALSQRFVKESTMKSLR